eukprot:1159846-Pelagomonas_calceolata.AAC.22
MANASAHDPVRAPMLNGWQGGVCAGVIKLSSCLALEWMIYAGVIRLSPRLDLLLTRADWDHGNPR